ncbi:MAG: hypothetical protein LPK03_05340 [Pontibacter sp.]|nr:hypothetical protein [Pontibacter sp.]
MAIFEKYNLQLEPLGVLKERSNSQHLIEVL